MKSAKHAVIIGLLAVLGGTAAVAGNSLRPSSFAPAGAPLAVEIEAGGLRLPQYGLYIPIQPEILDAAPF